jgi:hypothetical protein
MSASWCMHHALEIAKRPRAQWADAIKRIPTGCKHADCGEPRCCRTRNSEYLRMQWRIAEARARGRKVNP